MSINSLIQVSQEHGKLAMYWYKLIKQLSIIKLGLENTIMDFAITLSGLWTTVFFPVYSLLLVGTIMVTCADRCGLALVLKKMPWNKDLASED